MQNMRKVALLISLLFFAISAQATTTVTGSMKDLSGSAVTSGAFIRFYLRGCGGNIPRVSGTALIAPTQGGTWFKDFTADANGNISGTLYSTRDAAGTGNGEIDCGGSKTAAWYGLVPFVSGKAGPEIPVHAKNTGTLDITQVTPITTNPVIVAPTGDSTYLRLDAGNSPVIGNLTINGNLFATAFISRSATPAMAGNFRLASADSFCFRGFTNFNDVCLTKNSSDQWVFGGNGNAIVPVSAGGLTMGTVLLPWADLIVGSSPNQTTVIGTLATTNRNVNFPDAAGTVPMLSLTQTWTGPQTFSAATTFSAAATFNAAATLSSGGTLLGTFAGSPIFGGAAGAVDLAYGRVKSVGTAPTCAFTSGGGTGPSCTLGTGSTDSIGTISLVTGTGAPGASGSFTLTFSSTMGTNSPTCVMLPSNNGSAWNARATIFDTTPSTTSDLQNFDNNAVTLSTSSTFKVNYWCGAK